MSDPFFDVPFNWIQKQWAQQATSSISACAPKQKTLLSLRMTPMLRLFAEALNISSLTWLMHFHRFFSTASKKSTWYSAENCLQQQDKDLSESFSAQSGEFFHLQDHLFQEGPRESQSFRVECQAANRVFRALAFRSWGCCDVVVFHLFLEKLTFEVYAPGWHLRSDAAKRTWQRSVGPDASLAFSLYYYNGLFQTILPKQRTIHWSNSAWWKKK